MAALSCLVLVILSTIGVQGSVAARADNSSPSSWTIPKYNISATVDRNGDARVTLDLAFDFASDPGHGPVLTFTKKQKLTDDPDHWRMVDYSQFSASSSTGANADLQVNDQDAAVQIKIGTKGATYTGVQKYRISYTIHGLIALKNSSSGLDEFNWRVIENSTTEIYSAAVRITGPAEVSRTACYAPSPCQATSSGKTATFTTSFLATGDSLQVVAGFPAGTFSDRAAARLEKRYTPGNTFGLDPVTGVGTVMTALLAGWAALRARRRGRDKEFVGVAPGVIPADDNAPVAVRRKDPEVAVAFVPPDGVSPAEAGTLLDGSADTADVTAGMLDLAVRGHLTISPLDADRRGRTEDWSFTRNAGCTDTLRDWERDYLDMFFDGRRTITTAELRTQHDNRTLGVATGSLNRLVKDYGWYDADPIVLRVKALLAGLLVAAIGVAVAILGAFVGWGLLGIPVVLIGIAMMVTGVMRSPGRTATGTAVLDQIRSFRLYLTTAEADQIRFEEGIDVFSRYLPWATVFGVADRWVKIFQELETRGIYHGDYGWYDGGQMAFTMGFASGFSSSFNDMSSAMASSMQAASTSSTSSSDSGFSGGGFGGGGGGFGGGSVGGW